MEERENEKERVKDRDIAEVTKVESENKLAREVHLNSLKKARGG